MKKKVKKILIYVFYFIIILSLIIIIFIKKNQLSLNSTSNIILPELDNMYNIKVSNLNTIINNDFTSENYDSLQRKLNISLLNSELSLNNQYMLGQIKTDKKDYLIISYENYILGDTSDYTLNDEGFYTFNQGIEYHSPISIKVDIILSENQMKIGWDKEYLGLYDFVENYTSKQGYKVNILETTAYENNTENYISEKIAIFVADGIRYTLKGKTSIDNMKYIIDNMKYKFE